MNVERYKQSLRIKQRYLDSIVDNFYDVAEFTLSQAWENTPEVRAANVNHYCVLTSLLDELVSEQILEGHRKDGEGKYRFRRK